MSFDRPAGRKLLHLDISGRQEEGLPQRRESYLEELTHDEGANLKVYRLRLADQGQGLGFKDGGGTPLAEITLNTRTQNVTSVKSYEEGDQGFGATGNGNAFSNSGYFPELTEALYQLKDMGLARRFDALVEDNVTNDYVDDLFSLLSRDGKWEKFSHDKDPSDYLAGTVDIGRNMFVSSDPETEGISAIAFSRDEVEALAANAGITLSISDLTDTSHGREAPSRHLDVFPEQVDAHIRIRDHGTHDLTHFTDIASADVTNADRVILRHGSIREADIINDGESTKFEFSEDKRSYGTAMRAHAGVDAGADASM